MVGRKIEGKSEKSELRKICFLFSVLCFLSSVFCQAQQQEAFIYNDGGRRDPFLPLIDEGGRYRLDTELVYSSDELKLSGILWDPQGRSSCLINNQILEVGEVIGGFTVVEITKNSVLLSKEGKEHIIRLSEEEITKEE